MKIKKLAYAILISCLLSQAQITAQGSLVGKIATTIVALSGFVTQPSNSSKDTNSLSGGYKPHDVNYNDSWFSIDSKTELPEYGYESNEEEEKEWVVIDLNEGAEKPGLPSQSLQNTPSVAKKVKNVAKVAAKKVKDVAKVAAKKAKKVAKNQSEKAKNELKKLVKKTFTRKNAYLATQYTWWATKKTARVSTRVSYAILYGMFNTTCEVAKILYEECTEKASEEEAKC